MDKLKTKKEYAKDKLIERSGTENWRSGKYCYAISSIIGLLYDINKVKGKCETIIRDICKIISAINGCKYIDNIMVDLNSLESYKSLETLTDLATEKNDPRLIKQRSTAWFDIRSKAKVTGSTLYRSIGLDGLKNLKEHFEQVICGAPEKQFSEKVKDAMKHGVENEINAVATLVGKVIPVLFPGMIFCEEGCVISSDDSGNTFCVVSPDGSLRQDTSLLSTSMAVEIKCPTTDIHFQLPPRYLLQCLSQIEALNVNSLIYLSWTETLTSIFKVERNINLYNNAMEIARSIYDTSNPKRPNTLCSSVKTLKDEIERASKDACFLGCFPSAKVGKATVRSAFEVHTVHEISVLLNSLVDLHSQIHEIKREKATEAVVFICADLNRSWNKNLSLSSPVAWFTKGYSLETKKMREIAEEVHNRCHESGIHIPCQSFDGQWHNLVVRDSENNPLTTLQLQKDVWREVEQTKKTEVVSKFRGMNKKPKWIYHNENGSKVVVVSNYIRNVPPLKRNKILTSEKATPSNNSSDREITQGDECADNNTEDIVNDPEQDFGRDKEDSHLDEHISNEDAKCLLAMLKSDQNSNKKGKWNTSQVTDITVILSSLERMQSLLDADIRVIVRFFKKSKTINVNETATKQKKLEKLSEKLGLNYHVK
ncbi:uncharacterized protein LOC127864724 [Dreissena polymorpha]|uniref:YqaJ viral recombinase domain-containing protein n=1 Tax=Dreissena polymorpha TaxID=45954 RepID=A0A9D4SAM4_DREPO|nr:uncharacterized protein LOC127864724 [Dreissena polymorpha]KAH3898006.1 hypothetical protein DPMN_022202 [Dreissena polymorpha]